MTSEQCSTPLALLLYVGLTVVFCTRVHFYIILQYEEERFLRTNNYDIRSGLS